jgi:hypothetical protein
MWFMSSHMVRDTYIKNGLRFLSFGVPIERRTFAPTPSDCCTAKKDWRTARAIDELSGFMSDGSDGGTTGRPGKACSDLVDICLAFVWAEVDKSDVAGMCDSAVLKVLLSLVIMVSLW